MQIDFKKISYIYNLKTPYEKKVLTDIDLKINNNSFTFILGKTGSGKSTLIEHINGLLIPTLGKVEVDNLVISNKKSKKEKRKLEEELIKKREEIAVLFQFSEQQLFETTVLKDIIFAPLNYGISEEIAIQRAENLIELVGLDKSFLNRSPFELSGGEMRKVALCGVLSLNPKLLVLDEPTIGLDFKSKKEFFDLIQKIYKNENLTIVLVSHNIEYALNYATDIIIMDNGKVAYRTNDKIEFIKEIKNKNYNLTNPDIINLQIKLQEKNINLKNIHWDYESLLDELIKKVALKNE